MPPKPKKAPTPQGSKAGKSTKSTSSSTNLQTKDHYSIFVLNTQTDGAVSILREFVARAKKRKRNVVVPIVLEEIEKEISLDKAGAKTATSEHAKNDEANNIFSYDATAKEIFQFTQMRITKCIEEHDSFLTQLNSIKKSDLLQYWEESSGTATMSADMKKGAKSVPGKKGSSTTKDTKLQDTKKESKNGKKKKGNETVAEKSEYGDDNCKLEALPAIQLTTKMFSQFSHDIHESRAHQKYITDFPEDGPLLYILIIGSISADLCLDLLREKYPVAAIFSVCPNEEATPESSFQSLSDFLQNNALTKATYLQNLSFPALSKCDAIKESKMIYNELSWLLYDVVTSKRQHTNFLANLKEIDVSMKNFKCKDDIDWSTPKYQTELDIVPLYLNGLLSAVVASIEGTPASSSTQSILNNDSWHPFLQLHTKEIVEYRNYIIKNALSNNGYENLVYRKSLELLSVYGIPALLWRSLDCGSSGQRFSWNPSGNTSRLESKSINVQGPEITYVEIFTKNAMIQRFIELNNSYDFNYVEHCAERDELDVCFYNSDYQYFESCQTFHIPTRVCFRDYCKYVVPDLCEWIEEQELLYDAMLAQESGNQKQTKIIVFDDIIDENYVMQFALKTRADSMEKKKLSKTSMVEMRNLASQFISNEILFDSITAERNILKDSFTVYNIGDTRYQITSTRTKFKTAGGFVQILEDKMTSGEIMLRVDLDYLGERVMYNHTYPSRIDCPSMKISCNNSSTINFRMRPIVSGNKVMTKDALQGLESQFRAFYFDVHSAWPNGLTIRTFYDEATGGIIFVEQKVVVNSKGEIKRVYFPDGKLVIYYNDDFIEVLTPSGVTYEAVRILDADVDQTTSYSDGENSDELKMKQKKFFFELAAFHDLKCEVYKEKFKINTPEGHAFEIFEGSIERENRKQHLTEWNDYALGERYAMLEGGTKTRLSKNNFQVYYQNGTLFTTTTEEESIDENSGKKGVLCPICLRPYCYTTQHHYNV